MTHNNHNKLTPMMRQYLEIKDRYPDAFLFFRVGDFYELFFDDALKASAILNIALTSRDKNEKDAVPLCGVPYHAAESYIRKLVGEGYKVVLCDQVEDPKLAKGIVKREVVRVITPGTITDIDFLNPKDYNYLAAVYYDKEKNAFGIAYADISCGEVNCFETKDLVKDLLERLSLKEIVALKDYEKVLADLNLNIPFSFIEIKEDLFLGKNAEEKALDILSYYLKEIVMLPFFDTKGVKRLEPEAHLFFDENCKRDLEIFSPIVKGAKNSSLFDILDSTVTAMGSRKIKHFLTFPLRDKSLINERYAIVECFYNNGYVLKPLREVLKNFADLERILGNLFGNSPSPRYLISLKESLKKVPELKRLLTEINLAEVFELRELSDVINAIERAIVDDPHAMSLRDGNIIKKGYSSELDELREIIESGAEFIFNYQNKERERTKISSLKIGYNKVFGYYIEVTKANLHLVPPDYIRKQTLVNAERFITEELKRYEEKMLSASEKLRELELKLFKEFLDYIKCYSKDIQKLAEEIALIDVYSAFAYNAICYNYVKPEITDELVLEIEEGRHPFVERNVKNFVPNDTFLAGPDKKIMLITGPNMAGKSTYMRQVALLVLMAQIGSFVPAKRMRYSIMDQILTRIGTSDFLASGKSTFMVEMMETARILKETTKRSLVILDEVGRGTSTYDGMSIAWASLKYLAEQEESPFVLFSTHYHEIAEFSKKNRKIMRFTISVKEWNKEIIFLHKLKEGVANKSYGIHVAKLAGLPQKVIEDAEEILKSLEQDDLFEEKAKKTSKELRQLPLFSSKGERIMEEIKKLELERITPLEAFEILKNLKQMLE